MLIANLRSRWTGLCWLLFLNIFKFISLYSNDHMHLGKAQQGGQIPFS